MKRKHACVHPHATAADTKRILSPRDYSCGLLMGAGSCGVRRRTTVSVRSVLQVYSCFWPVRMHSERAYMTHTRERFTVTNSNPFGFGAICHTWHIHIRTYQVYTYIDIKSTFYPTMVLCDVTDGGLLALGGTIIPNHCIVWFYKNFLFRCRPTTRTTRTVVRHGIAPRDNITSACYFS